MWYLRKTKKIFPAIYSHKGSEVIHLFYTALTGPLPSCAQHWASSQKKHCCTEKMRPMITKKYPKQRGDLEEIKKATGKCNSFYLVQAPGCGARM